MFEPRWLPLIVLCFAGWTAAAAPANDNFNNAAVLDGTSPIVRSSNVGATREIGEPNHAANQGGRSIWWKWTAPSSGSAVIQTQGSSFDTLLAIYSGTAIGNLDQKAGNDDAGRFSTSLAGLNVTSGTTYWIAIDGFNGASGDVVLSLTFRPASLPRPQNDSFTNSTPLLGLDVALVESTFFATKEPGEPNHGHELGGASVWWNWQAPQSGQVKVTTAGSDFDTLLSVYTGTVLTNLALIASNDDVSTNNSTSSLTFAADADTIYQIAVDGFNAEPGEVHLQVQMENTVLLALPQASLENGFKLTVTGAAGKSYDLETSSDLVHWTSLVRSTNQTGTVHFTDSKAISFHYRFYRAVQLP